MARTPSKRLQMRSAPAAKKASRSVQRLKALKGEQNHGELGQSASAKQLVPTDHGFKDLRTFQEKQRLLLWVKLCRCSD